MQKVLLAQEADIAKKLLIDPASIKRHLKRHHEARSA